MFTVPASVLGLQVIRDSGALCSILDALRCFLNHGRAKVDQTGGAQQGKSTGV